MGALIVVLLSSVTARAEGPKRGGATATALAQDSKPKAKPAPRSAGKPKKPAPTAARIPKAHPKPRAIGPKPVPTPKAAEPAKEKAKDKGGHDDKVDRRKSAPRARA
jgi:hypothetical protein